MSQRPAPAGKTIHDPGYVPWHTLLGVVWCPLCRMFHELRR